MLFQKLQRLEVSGPYGPQILAESPLTSWFRLTESGFLEGGYWYVKLLWKFALVTVRNKKLQEFTRHLR